MLDEDDIFPDEDFNYQTDDQGLNDNIHDNTRLIEKKDEGGMSMIEKKKIKDVTSNINTEKKDAALDQIKKEIDNDNFLFFIKELNKIVEIYDIDFYFLIIHYIHMKINVFLRDIYLKSEHDIKSKFILLFIIIIEIYMLKLLLYIISTFFYYLLKIIYVV